MFGRHPLLLRHWAAIFRDIGMIVVRAEAAIETGVDAIGYAAVARKESVAQAGNGREQRRCQLHGSSALASCFPSINPASEVRWGSGVASTLNVDRRPPRPPPITRFSP